MKLKEMTVQNVRSFGEKRTVNLNNDFTILIGLVGGRMASHVWLRVTELSVSSPGEFPMQRSREGQFSGWIDLSEYR
jgi:hypothetical protein